MKFPKEDENYIYELICKNIKKYRKRKGWTQEKLAEEAHYSLSFISGIESSYHQTFSLGTVWKISQVLGVEFCKLCEEDSIEEKKGVSYQCNQCGLQMDMPIQVVRHFQEIYELAGSKDVPHFHCTQCEGELFPTNPMEL